MPVSFAGADTIWINLDSITSSDDTRLFPLGSVIHFNHDGEPTVAIYPNPFEAKINIQILGNSNMDPSIYKLTNIHGSVMLSGVIYKNSIEVSKEISSGIYVLSIYFQNGSVENFKVIKK